jgi:DNA-binding transcriptional MerR regulator
MNNQEQWLSILEYAAQTGNSISTTRRYIKSGKIKSKQVNGKYLILCELREKKPNNEFASYEKQIARQNREIEDLRTLIMLYESNFSSPEALEELLKERLQNV